MRSLVTKLGFAAAISLGLAGAAAAAPVPTAPDGQAGIAGNVALASNVPVTWARWHGGWRHPHWRHPHWRHWRHHPRHWGWRRRWHHRW